MYVQMMVTISKIWIALPNLSSVLGLQLHCSPLLPRQLRYLRLPLQSRRSAPLRRLPPPLLLPILRRRHRQQHMPPSRTCPPPPAAATPSKKPRPAVHASPAILRLPLLRCLRTHHPCVSG